MLKRPDTKLWWYTLIIIIWVVSWVNSSDSTGQKVMAMSPLFVLLLLFPATTIWYSRIKSGPCNVDVTPMVKAAPYVGGGWWLLTEAITNQSIWFALGVASWSVVAMLFFAWLIDWWCN